MKSLITAKAKQIVSFHKTLFSRQNICAFVLFVLSSSYAQQDLLQKLFSQDQTESQIAVERVTQLDSKGKQTIILAIIQKIKTEDNTTRNRAIDLLSTIATFTPQIKIAIPSLIEALKDSSIEIREKVIILLGELRSEASKVVPALINQLNIETDERVKMQILTALGLFGRAAQEATEKILQLLSNESGTVLAVALQNLGKIGGDPDKLTQVFIEFLHHDSFIIRHATLLGLSEAEIVNKPIILALFESLQDQNNQIRYTAGVVLTRLSTSEESVIPAYLEAIKHQNPDIRWKVIKGLGRMLQNGRVNSQRQELIQAIKKAQKDPAPRVREQAELTLNDLAFLNQNLQEQQKIQLALTELQDPNPTIRRKAAKTLSELENPNSNIQMFLQNALRDSDPEVRFYCALPLTKFAPPLSQLLPEFLWGLNHSNGEIKEKGLIVFKELGEKTIQPLISMLQTSDSNIQLQIIHAFEELAIPSDEVLNALDLLSQQNPTEAVRKQASTVFKKLQKSK